VDDDVDPAKAFTNGAGHKSAALGSGNIGGDEQLGVGELGGCRSGGGENCHPGLAQSRHHSLSYPLGATGNERPAASQLDTVVHGPTSEDTIETTVTI